MFQSYSYQLYEMAHAALAPARAVSDAAHFGLMTVEGEKDDISGVGQTYAAQELCVNIPESRKLHHLQRQVGHYGVFNGSRFRNEIAPRIRAFIAMNDEKRAISNGGGKSAGKRATVEARERAECDARAPSIPEPIPLIFSSK
jgi:poly-beta-hydroxyalkanoate depolymerase